MPKGRDKFKYNRIMFLITNLEPGKRDKKPKEHQQKRTSWMVAEVRD